MSAEVETPSSPASWRILSASYLEKHSSKRDLVRRLRTVANALRHDEDVEPDSPDFPGLAALAACLVQNFLDHRDKEVRLYTVLCCMELFAVYAPEAPWSESEIYDIFQQTIRQLANLAHTTDPTQANYDNYVRILELLAVVKIGVVLVDLAKTRGDMLEGVSEQAEPDSPLELLSELFKTTLQSLRLQHPHLVTDYSQKVISGCLEEYSGGLTVPLPLVEEILICVAQPNIIVTKPAAAQSSTSAKSGKNRKPSPPEQVKQQNPAYVVATTIIRKHLDGLSTPVASLLNGLINGEARIVQRSSLVTQAGDDDDDEAIDCENQSGVDVWTIIYELGRVAPSILTTVIGTVSACLTSPEAFKRQKAVKLLGKMFYAQDSRFAIKFAPCFRQWLSRCIDTEQRIRIMMVTNLVSILKANQDPEIVKESDDVLARMVQYDPKLEVRLAAVHDICDWVYETNGGCPVSVQLLQAVGSRVMSKQHQERLVAVTGLAQIYYKKYMINILRDIQVAEDDCSTELVSRALAENCTHAAVFSTEGVQQGQFGNCIETGKYKWIPSRIFECMFYSDASDPKMRNLLVQIVDELLLGCDDSTTATKHLTATARAVGFVAIVDSLRKPGECVWSESESDAFKWMVKFFRQRAQLQKALGNYIDARTMIRKFTSGSEEALTAEATAMTKLRVVASMLPQVEGSSTDDVLEKLHSARDKHIFRILATLCDPKHGKISRARALDELPKRAKSLGDSVTTWVKTLVRRCSMGYFINSENVRHNISLAKSCFDQNDIFGSTMMLSCAKLSLEIFPSLCCGDDRSFEILKDVFSNCRSLVLSDTDGEVKNQIEDSGMITTLSSMLTLVGRTNGAPEDSRLDRGLRKQLLTLCTKDGTPQQARNAVESLAALCFPNEAASLADSAGPPNIRAFTSVLEELTSPSIMSVDSGQIISILSSLGALAERAPESFRRCARGEKAVRFALEAVLLGRSHGPDKDESSDDEGSTDETCTMDAPKYDHSSIQHKSPKEKQCLLEDTELSFSCRRLCAAIEFLVGFVRASILLSSRRRATVPSAEQIKVLFRVLTQIIRDHGIPPSNRDRNHCRARNDRAALRQCAAVQLIRLCDSRIKLESTFLCPYSWHILSSAFLDEERAVRQAVIDEYISMMTGSGVFRMHGQQPGAPALRFVALIALCADGDNSSGHSRANGNAANIGKRSSHAKMAARKCVSLMRQAFDDMYAKCLQGRDRQKQAEFETWKTRLMPEYLVPYAFHLLAFRRETPSEYSGRQLKHSSDDGIAKTSEDAQHRMLKKRLKYVFDPLVESLGDSADNISFLLSMTSSLSLLSLVHVGPSEPLLGHKTSPSGSLSLDSKGADPITSPTDSSINSDDLLADAKLKSICEVAREVLLGFVKKDVNLTEHPGEIQIPTFLFHLPRRKSPRCSVPEARAVAKVQRIQEDRSNRDNFKHSSEKKRNASIHWADEIDSPTIEFNGRDSQTIKDLSPGVSPILQSCSPDGREAQTAESEEKTLSPGTTNNETPVSTKHSSKMKGGNVDEGHSPVLGNKAKRPNLKVPSQIEIGHREFTPKENKGMHDFFSFDSDEKPFAKPKPLGAANSRGSKRSKGTKNLPSGKRTRRSLRSRS